MPPLSVVVAYQIQGMVCVQQVNEVYIGIAIVLYGKDCVGYIVWGPTPFVGLTPWCPTCSLSGQIWQTPWTTPNVV